MVGGGGGLGYSAFIWVRHFPEKKGLIRESPWMTTVKRELTSYSNFIKMGGSSITPTSAEEAKTKKNYKLWLKIEVTFLSVLIIGVWSLLSLPIMFYYLPISEVRYTRICCKSKPLILVK